MYNLFSLINNDMVNRLQELSNCNTNQCFNDEKFELYNQEQQQHIKGLIVQLQNQDKSIFRKLSKYSKPDFTHYI